MNRQLVLGLGCAAGGMLGGVFALAQNPPPGGESERKVQEADVPKAALDAIKKLAGGAAITELAEEIEHGHTFYEGSWKGPNGNVDGLVTASGDVVEIEESVPAAMVPAAVRAEAQKAAGKGANLTFEKKTMVLYEMHFKKDGKTQEMILTPDARRYEEEGAAKGEPEQDEDEE